MQTGDHGQSRVLRVQPWPTLKPHSQTRALITQINTGLSAKEPFVDVSSATELLFYLERAASLSKSAHRAIQEAQTKQGACRKRPDPPSSDTTGRDLAQRAAGWWRLMPNNDDIRKPRIVAGMQKARLGWRGCSLTRCRHLEGFIRFWCPAQKLIFDGRVARRSQKVTLKIFSLRSDGASLNSNALIVRGPTPLISQSRIMRHGQRERSRLCGGRGRSWKSTSWIGAFHAPVNSRALKPC